MILDYEEYVIDIVEEYLRSSRHGATFHSLRPLPRSGFRNLVKNGPDIYEFYDSTPKPGKLLFVSNKLAPRTVLGVAEKTFQVQKRLVPRLAEVVVCPLHVGEYDGCSYAIFEKHITCNGRYSIEIKKFLLRASVINWLEQVAITTSSLANSEYVGKFIHALSYVLNDNNIPGKDNNELENIVSDTDCGKFECRTCLTHGDFWWGNILIDNNFTNLRDFRFNVIDWGSCLIQGFPFIDLIALIDDLRIKSNAKRNILEKYALKLNIPQEHINCYIYAYIGVLGLNRNELPYERFLLRANRLLSYRT